VTCLVGSQVLDPDAARARASSSRTITPGQRRQSTRQIARVSGSKRRVGEPLRAPWVEMKYSRTESPSRNEEMIGEESSRPRIRDEALHTGDLSHLLRVTRAPESTIVFKGLNL